MLLKKGHKVGDHLRIELGACLGPDVFQRALQRPGRAVRPRVVQRIPDVDDAVKAAEDRFFYQGLVESTE